MRQNSSQLQILLEYTHSLSSENFFSTQLFSLDISPSPLTFRKKIHIIYRTSTNVYIIITRDVADATPARRH